VAARPQQTLPDLTTPTTAGDDGADPVHLALLGLLLVGGIWLVGVPSAGAVRRGRRRSASHGHPEREVADAWTDSLRALALIDLRPHRAETPDEFARRAAADAGTDADAHLELASLATAATFGSSTGPGEVTRARRAAAMIGSRCRRLAGPWRRLQAAVSPRRQLRDG
jgi:hypothetical protein